MRDLDPAATHAILPLLTLRESIDMQLQVGIESHRHRFHEWGGGLWLPLPSSS